MKTNSFKEGQLAVIEQSKQFPTMKIPCEFLKIRDCFTKYHILLQIVLETQHYEATKIGHLFIMRGKIFKENRLTRKYHDPQKALHCIAILSAFQVQIVNTVVESELNLNQCIVLTNSTIQPHQLLFLSL